MSIQRLDHVNFITQDMMATIDFYCNSIGLECREPLPLTSLKTVYLYVPNQDVAVLHIGHAQRVQNSAAFVRLAKIPENFAGDFATGVFDHFALLLDAADYEPYCQRFKAQGLTYQTYCEPDGTLKQIWVLDPNGVRVELSFVDLQKIPRRHGAGV